MNEDCLPFLGEGTGPVARLPGGLVSRALFVAQIEALARLLPDRPYMVNFCTDRYAFTLGWAAAMLRGQVMLLPPSRDRAAVGALQPDYPGLYVLGDDASAAAMGADHYAFPTLDVADGQGRSPAFPPGQVAAVLFTSGSTGRPQPSIRSWGRLVASSHAAGAALRLDALRGAALIATVPHGHSYGLESAVVLPLQLGLLLTPDRPFFPADVIAAMAGQEPPAMLVTTPVHLQALTQDAAAKSDDRHVGNRPADDSHASSHRARDGRAHHRAQKVRAGLVLSATAPLADVHAAAAEALFDAPVCEIYGCSEAGQLATRRTLDGPVWRCLDGFRLYDTIAGCWAAGPHEPDVLLADRIELSGHGFILKGRNADLVNVAGKRSSLAYLSNELTAVEGVRDGVFLNPEADPSGVAQRLVAIAVAPGLDATAVVARLRQRIDPAFLPRPLCLVDTLPRNALGKLSRTELLALVMRATRPDLAAPIRLHIPADLPAARGHFPGHPIVPGAVLLDHVLTAIETAHRPAASPTTGAAVGPAMWAATRANTWRGVIDAAKFHHPVRPGDTIEITHRIENAATRFECRLAGSRHLVLSGALRSPFPPP